MEGIHWFRRSLPKYSFTWDINILLGKYRELPPNDQLDLKALTLALILCQLAQTIFTLDLRHIKNDKYTIQIAFQSVLKHSRPGRHVKSVILTFYLADKKICLVEVFNTYLKAIKEIRKCETKLKIL